MKRDILYRIPLCPNTTVELSFEDADGRPESRYAVIRSVIGSGSSCICYDVDVQWDTQYVRRMILKQFYPDPRIVEVGVHIEQNKKQVGDRVVIQPNLHMDVICEDEQDPAVQKITLFRDNFQRAYDLQHNLAYRSGKVGLVVVRPAERSRDGQYILYEADWSRSLSFRRMEWDRLTQKEVLLEQMTVVWQTARALCRLHEQHILHMDLKPANILWIRESNLVKFFDFDASIQMNKLDDIKSLRGDSDIRCLAPELRQNSMDYILSRKEILFKPSIDIFSLGAILYGYLTGKMQPPDDEIIQNENALREELDVRFQNEYRGLFTQKQQEFIKKTVWRSIAAKRIFRYSTAPKMAQDMQRIVSFLTLENQVNTPAAAADYALLAAKFLDEHPLYTSWNPQKCKLHIMLAGQSCMRDAFFHHVFSCAQFPKTLLCIHMVDEDASRFRDELFQKFPALKETVLCNTNGEESACYNNRIINEQPLASLFFHDTADWYTTAVQLLKAGTQYFLFADTDYDKNRSVAKLLAEQCGHPAFIGFGDWRGDGVALRTLESTEPTYSNMVMTAVFPLTASWTEKDREKEIQYWSHVEQLAFGIHQFYSGRETKESEQHYRAQDRKTFEAPDANGEYYNKLSSIRAALSIPYKLYISGTDLQQPNAVQKYTEFLRDENNRNLLMWLEHRSWLCFMLLNGWGQPEDLEQTVFVDNNTQQDKSRKLHSCICDSRPDSMTLSDLPKTEQAWREAYEQREQYDLLDQMSLELHQICVKRSDAIRLEPYFDLLRQELQQAGAEENMLRMVDIAETASGNLLNKQSGAENEWKHAVIQLSSIKESYTIAGKVAEIIVMRMKAVQERNQFHDYKKSDADIVDALPKLLESNFIKMA